MPSWQVCFWLVPSGTIFGMPLKRRNGDKLRQAMPRCRYAATPLWWPLRTADLDLMSLTTEELVNALEPWQPWSSMILEITTCKMLSRMFPMISCERGNLASKFNAKVLWPQVDSVALQFFVGRFGTDNCCFPWKNPKHIRQRLVWITCSQVPTAEGDDDGGIWTVYSIVSNDVFRWPCKRHKFSEFECAVCAVWSLQVQHPSLWCVWWTCGVETLAHRRLQSFSRRKIETLP